MVTTGQNISYSLSSHSIEPALRVGWVDVRSAALTTTGWAGSIATCLGRLCSEAATHPFPQPVRIPTLSVHPAADPMTDSPELPSAEEEERHGRQEEQNRSQYQPQDDQKEP